MKSEIGAVKTAVRYVHGAKGQSHWKPKMSTWKIKGSGSTPKAPRRNTSTTQITRLNITVGRPYLTPRIHIIYFSLRGYAGVGNCNSILQE